MNAWLTARRVKRGHEEEFRKKWRSGDAPDGMLDSFLLEDEDDPRETLSISFWGSADKLLKYRTGDEARKRQADLSDVVDKDRWARSFVSWNALDMEAPGRGRKWLIFPLLLAAAGAGLYFLLAKRRGGHDADDWDSWEPEPANVSQPDAVMQSSAASTRAASPATATAAPASMPRPAGTGTPTDGPRAEAAAPRRPGAARHVRDLMTANPETVDIGTDAATAARRMRALNVGVLPVTAEGALAGIITDRDLALAVAARNLKPSSLKVGDLMSETPRTISPDASIEDAAKLMADHQIRRLPVVDGTRLVGILSLGDLAADGAERAAAAALHEISESVATRA